MINITMNNGGKRIDNNRRPENPHNWNINTILYNGTKIPHPGSPALVNVFHREITIKMMIAR